MGAFTQGQGLPGPIVEMQDWTFCRLLPEGGWEGGAPSGKLWQDSGEGLRWDPGHRDERIDGVEGVAVTASRSVLPQTASCHPHFLVKRHLFDRIPAPVHVFRGKES